MIPALITLIIYRSKTVDTLLERCIPPVSSGPESR